MVKLNFNHNSKKNIYWCGVHCVHGPFVMQGIVPAFRVNKHIQNRTLHASVDCTYGYPLFVCLGDFPFIHTVFISTSRGLARCQWRSQNFNSEGQDLLLYYVFSIISINYKYIFYIKTKITNLYSS